LKTEHSGSRKKKYPDLCHEKRRICAKSRFLGFISENVLFLPEKTLFPLAKCRKACYNNYICGFASRKISKK